MQTTNSLPRRWGHPQGLFYLFFAELWERFSFYGMRALLVLYMTKQLLFTDKMSFGVYAAYGSLVYLTPLFGGMIADRVLGYRRSIVLGGVLMSLGHFMLTFEHTLFFYGALGIIIVGNGFFKPNISSFVGALYPQGDPKRDSGFTIFYMGINIGGWLAPLLCAWLAQVYGWHYGFGLAGIGMLLGLWFFNRGAKADVFGDKGYAPDQEKLLARQNGISQEQKVWLGAVFAVPVFSLIVYFHEFEHYLVGLVTVLVLFILGKIYSEVTPEQKQQLLVVVWFTLLMSLFWAIFEQAGSSLTLFADRNVDLSFMNAAQTNSINSGFIILLALPFSWLWTKLSQLKANPPSPYKFGIGLFLLGLSFVIFAFSARQADSLAQTPMFYLILGYFVFTVGEMFISPIGLSKMTELAPARYAAFIMGVFFLSSFYGHYFAGKIAALTDLEGGASPFSSGIMGSLVEMITGLSQAGSDKAGAEFSQLYSYVSVYAGSGVACMLVGLLALGVAPLIKKMMHGVR